MYDSVVSVCGCALMFQYQQLLVRASVFSVFVSDEMYPKFGRASRLSRQLAYVISESLTSNNNKSRGGL